MITFERIGKAIIVKRVSATYTRNPCQLTWGQMAFSQSKWLKNNVQLSSTHPYHFFFKKELILNVFAKNKQNCILRRKLSTRYILIYTMHFTSNNFVLSIRISKRRQWTHYLASGLSYFPGNKYAYFPDGRKYWKILGKPRNIKFCNIKC